MRNQNRSASPRAKALLLLWLPALAISALACRYEPPVYTPSAPQQTAGALNATYQAGTATANAGMSTEIPRSTMVDKAVTTGSHVTVTPSVTATVTPSVTPNPTSSIIELPTLAPGTAIYEVPPETGGALDDGDIRALAQLCTVEVRGMGDRRDAACISVVSTVLTRMARRELSDGTVIGTITHGCKPGMAYCQFPAYAVQGCRGITASACPLNYPDVVTHFMIVVYEYLRLRVLTDGACQGYTYYGSRSIDRGGVRSPVRPAWRDFTNEH